MLDQQNMARCQVVRKQTVQAWSQNIIDILRGHWKKKSWEINNARLSANILGDSTIKVLILVAETKIHLTTCQCVLKKLDE